MASAARVANSTALRLSTGNAPGRPRQTGQTLVLGGFPNFVEQEQKIFVAVRSWTWTSSPMTGSYLARAGVERSAGVAIEKYYSGWSSNLDKSGTQAINCCCSGSAGSWPVTDAISGTQVQSPKFALFLDTAGLQARPPACLHRRTKSKRAFLIQPNYQ